MDRSNFKLSFFITNPERDTATATYRNGESSIDVKYVHGLYYRLRFHDYTPKQKLFFYDDSFNQLLRFAGIKVNDNIPIAFTDEEEIEIINKLKAEYEVKLNYLDRLII